MASGIVSASIEIDAPPETIFDILADPRQHPRIDGSGSLTGSLSGPERLSKGAEFGMSMKIGAPYKITNTVVEFEEGSLIAWRHFAGHRWRYRLEPTGTGPGSSTRVTEEFDYSRLPLLQRKGLELVGFPARNRKGIEETLPRLKAAAESDVSR